jgi:cell division protein FtsZ
MAHLYFERVKVETMAITLETPDITELKPRIVVFGVGGAGGNAVNNMITSKLQGVDFVVANTDAQALTQSKASRVLQMGVAVTEGLGAGSLPDIGAAAAEEIIDEIRDQLSGVHMAFITAGMGGGTGTGAAPVIARAAREMGILTVGVVTKPFLFEGPRRMKVANAGIEQLQASVDTLIVIPNQNLFRVANEKTTFADAFAMADEVLYSGVACITDLMVKEGLINLDFADVRAVMRDMGKAMMGTGEASGEKRAIEAAEAAISNPLLDETSMKGAQGLLISITGGNDLTLYEVDEAASRIRAEVDEDANIILGATFDETLEGVIRVSVVATGIERAEGAVEDTPTRPIKASEAVARPQTAAAPMAPAAPKAAAPAAPAAPVAPKPVQANLPFKPVMPAAQPVIATQGAASLSRMQAQPVVTAPIVESAPAPAQEDQMEESFIPEAPRQIERQIERPISRAPSLADLPEQNRKLVERETNAQAMSYEDPAHPSQAEKPETLISKIAMGLKRRVEHEFEENVAQAMRQEPQVSNAEPQMARPNIERPSVERPTVERQVAMPQKPAARAATTGFEPPVNRPQRPREEEAFEIPAFLRRNK